MNRERGLYEPVEMMMPKRLRRWRAMRARFGGVPWLYSLAELLLPALLPLLTPLLVTLLALLSAITLRLLPSAAPHCTSCPCLRRRALKVRHDVPHHNSEPQRTHLPRLVPHGAFAAARSALVHLGRRLEDSDSSEWPKNIGEAVHGRLALALCLLLDVLELLHQLLHVEQAD